MGDLVRKRGRPVKVGGRRRRLELRMSDVELEMLMFLARTTGKTFTDILMDGLKKQYEDVWENGYEPFDYYHPDDFD